ncbi:MAG: polysaccharide pyruvyl transferase family protein [Oscillospiraceae bacterium]
MAKYLIRGGKVPTERLEIDNYVNCNVMGSNSGNFMYLYGIIRTLTLDESVTFESTRYRYDFTDKEIERFNSEFDGFIIPLADAFRDSFMDELEGLTRLIKRLTIPSYVIGVGVKAGAEQKLADKNFGFEDKVKNFVDAVLKNSNSIGVRGETTGEFLEYLGYKESRDFTVIGCPSMYTFGNNIKIRDTVKSPDCKATYNLTYYSEAETIDYIERAAKEFKDIIFVPQLVSELKLLYWGTDYKHGDKDESKLNYPSNLKHPVYAEDRVRFFVNVNDWIDFMRTRDLAFGTRLHGNIPAVLAGTPSILVTKDIRMRELAKFHGLTSVDETELKDYKDIWEIIQTRDFHSPEAKQRANFENYLNFLHSNGFKTIYDEDIDRKDAPMDKLVEENGVHNEFKSAALCSKKEITTRMSKSIKFVKKQVKELKAENKALTAENTALAKGNKKYIEKYNKEHGNVLTADAELEHAKKILNCRTVRYAIKLRNAFLPADKKIKL